MANETFFAGTDWQQSSGPYTVVQVHESDIWPIADNSISGTKDAIDEGLHPVVAIGGRTAALGCGEFHRRLNRPVGSGARQHC